MARGESGRIVIEVQPEVKRRLYSALALTGSTLKDWFIRAAADYCSETAQPSLFPATHKTKDQVGTDLPFTGQRDDRTKGDNA
ncbi:MAG TPA: hypothetical protein PKJ98_04630 [Verrucomicrobiota bacterium]|nr:hypothetical protein [Verrucomicrobiota bacterium]